MKHIRSAALSRRRAPPFVAAVQSEVLLLRQLSPWVRWLYLELRMLSDFATGHLRTSWAVLESLLDCDGNQAFAPGPQAIRRGVQQLIDVRLVQRSAKANMGQRQLFLKVRSIKHFRSPFFSADRPADRQADRPPTPENTNIHAGSKRVEGSKPTDQPTDQPTGDSRLVFIPPNPPRYPRLSTDAEDALTVEMRQRLAAVRAKTKMKWAPQGA